jgi:16S rRNA (guanine966-N2)-methyltransferase
MLDSGFRVMYAWLHMAIRITGGIWRGRRLHVPEKGVRPTQDKVRAAIFSSLQNIVPGAVVLDLFAGSGAFGLEALSRGAEFVCFVDNNRKVVDSIKDNIVRLASDKNNSAGKWKIIFSDAIRFIDDSAVARPFDIIFADPPYDEKGEWAKKILLHLLKQPILKKEGYLIIESSAKSPLINTGEWSIFREKNYGETRVCIYQVTRFKVHSSELPNKS